METKSRREKKTILAGAYEKLIGKNLRTFCEKRGPWIASRIGARAEGDFLRFMAFGEDCCIHPGHMTLSGNLETGPKGVVISLYLLHANDEPMRLLPLMAFKDLPGSMPYHGAFRANSETPLVPHVTDIRKNVAKIRRLFQGEDPPDGLGGDFSFVLYPLPKIALCYIFYLPDEDFPASVTCLFSANALSFMPIDGLADAAEYTSRRLMVPAR